MSQALFNSSLAFVIHWEGGYVNNPADAGGPTNHGITQATYNSYLKKQNLPLKSVEDININDVRVIYQLEFWEPSYAYLFNYPLALTLFDTYVNFIPKTSNSFNLQALSLPLMSTKMQVVEAMVNGSQLDIAIKIIELRKAFRYERVKENPSQKTFLQGWINRDNALEDEITLPTYYKQDN